MKLIANVYCLAGFSKTLLCYMSAFELHCVINKELILSNMGSIWVLQLAMEAIGLIDHK